MEYEDFTDEVRQQFMRQYLLIGQIMHKDYIQRDPEKQDLLTRAARYYLLRY